MKVQQVFKLALPIALLCLISCVHRAALPRFPASAAFVTPLPDAFKAQTEKGQGEVLRSIRQLMRSEQIATQETTHDSGSVTILTQYLAAPSRGDRRRYEIAYKIDVGRNVVIINCLLESTGIYEQTRQREDAWHDAQPCNSRLIAPLLKWLNALEKQ